MPDPEDRGFHAFVHGRVQGVGFRYSAEREARRLQVKGWIRNSSDGDVEVYAEGRSENLRQFASWLREGPPGASVHDVDFHDEDFSGRYTSFSIRP